MNHEHVEEMLNSPAKCDDSKEDSLCSMLKDFYSRRMLSVIILVWAYAIVFIALAVLVGVKFFKAELTRSQIMYAVIFICCIQFTTLIKIFAWQMIHRNSIKQEIKKLGLRIAELNETVKNR